MISRACGNPGENTSELGCATLMGIFASLFVICIFLTISFFFYNTIKMSNDQTQIRPKGYRTFFHAQIN